MFDLALVEKCSDSSLKPEIVRKFIEQAGSQDPLAITVKAGDRRILIHPAKTEDEAMETTRRYIGSAVVRVGLTQFPAGLGVSDVKDLDPGLVEPCRNLEIGTALFAKVYRIVVAWYGSPAPEAFEDALIAWQTGYFEGRAVFREPDPGELTDTEGINDDIATPLADEKPVDNQHVQPTKDDFAQAGMRVDLSRLGLAK